MNEYAGEENYFAARIKRLRQRLVENDADAIIVSKDENIYYLTGFYGKNSASLLLITQKEAFLIVHFIYYEKAKKSVLLKEINLVEFKSKRDEKFNEIIAGSEAYFFGVESNYIDHEQYIKYRDILEKTGRELMDLPGFIEKQREIKDQHELESIIKACSIIDGVINNIISMDLEHIKSFSEIKLSLYLEEMMVDMGASSKSFDLIVAGNESSSLPHYEASDVKIKEGVLLFDIGCIYRHYCSDITRTIFLGANRIGKGENGSIEKYKAMHKIYDIVLNAQLKALEKCREGITCAELDAVSRDFIEKSGYGQYFGHSLGHGTGLEVHESPKVSYTDNTVLKENMVITIEPGIYLEDIGGVRIEDMVIVKKNGCINLYSSPKTETFIKKAGVL